MQFPQSHGQILSLVMTAVSSEAWGIISLLLLLFYVFVCMGIVVRRRLAEAGSLLPCMS